MIRNSLPRLSFWPPGRSPIVVAVLATHARADAAPNDALVARAAATALAALDR